MEETEDWETLAVVLVGTVVEISVEAETCSMRENVSMYYRTCGLPCVAGSNNPELELEHGQKHVCGLFASVCRVLKSLLSMPPLLSIGGAL